MKKTQKQQQRLRKRQKRVEKELKRKKVRRQKIYMMVLLALEVSFALFIWGREVYLNRNGYYHFEYGVVEGVSRGNHFEYKIDYLSIPEGAKKSSEPCYKVIKGDTVVVKVFDKWPYSTTVVEVKQRSFK